MSYDNQNDLDKLKEPLTREALLDKLKQDTDLKDLIGHGHTERHAKRIVHKKPFQIGSYRRK
jgi:hypothetical protein